MLFSILMQGKNDNYGADALGRGGVSKRLQMSLAKICDNLIKLNKPDIELVFCDWGSEENNKIHQFLNPACKCIKYIYVPPHITNKYNKDAKYSIVHPYNTSFRRSTGLYTMFVDSDFYMSYDSFERLYLFVKQLVTTNKKDFFWGSRYHIPRSIYINAKNFKDVDVFLNETSLSDLRHDKININNFFGTAMALLLHREIGEESTCWWEELTYWGWQDIELHRRLSTKQNCMGDIEDNNIHFFHLDHHDVHSFTHSNPHIYSNSYTANSEPWGLINEQLEIINFAN